MAIDCEYLARGSADVALPFLLRRSEFIIAVTLSLCTAQSMSLVTAVEKRSNHIG
jgi:hypothetical protein